MKIRINDIAKKAGVSDGTVSNALNNRKGISEEKKEYILKIAREMGYFKNNSNQNKLIRLLMLDNKAHVIGDTPFFSELIRGIETETSRLGYELIINHVSSEDFENIDAIIKTNQTSGVLLLATEMELENLTYFENLCIPLVILDTAFKNLKFDYVAINNVDGTYEIVKHLIDYGHKNIGIINSSYQINNFKERKLGYTQALNDNNLVAMTENEAIVEPNIEGAYIDMKVYFESYLKEYNMNELPSAYFAVNDNIAIGAIKAINEMQLPISICGFDNMPVSELISLTTVHVNKQYLGKVAVSRLIEKIINKDSDIQKILIATNIVKRNSIEKLK